MNQTDKSLNRYQPIQWLGFGLACFLAFILLWHLSEPQKLFGDFTKGYYLAGSLVLKDPANLYGKAGESLSFVNLPIIAFLFVPFSLFNKSIAVILMTSIGLLASIVACYLSIRIANIKGRKKLILVGLYFVNSPLYYNLKIGNTTQFVLLALLLTVFFISRKREFWAGSLLAIAAIIKLPILLLAVYFVIRTRWKVVIGFGVTCTIIISASLLLFGLHLHQSWFEQCILPYLGQPLAASNVQSVDGFLARLLTHHSIQNWTPISVDWIFKLVKYCMVSILLGGTLWVFWRTGIPKTKEQVILEFSAVLCLSLLISPISWTHYYLLLLLPLSFYLGGTFKLPNHVMWSILIAISTTLVSIPTTHFNANQPLLKLFISHYFFGGVLLLGILLASRWQTSRVKHINFLDGSNVLP
jgi:Glycosyltransferase family 87